MLKISVNTAAFDKRLVSARKKCGDLSEPMRNIGVFFEAQVEQGFADQRDPYGQAWKPLADSTLRARRKRGNTDTTILIDKGRMLRSLRFTTKRDELLVKMNKPAEFHQEGRPNLPQRRIFPISFGQRYLPKKWTDGMLAILKRFVEKF